MTTTRTSRGGFHKGPRNGKLRTRCWCDTSDVFVAVQQVRDGVTGSCGRPECTPAFAAAS